MKTIFKYNLTHWDETLQLPEGAINIMDTDIYVGTIKVDDGRFIWHIYERPAL